MKIIYESTFMILTYKSSLKLMEIVWLPTKNSMLTAQFQSEFLTFLLYRDQYKCERLLLDERHLNFKGSPSIQKWIKEIISKRTNYHTKKVALLVGAELPQKKISKESTYRNSIEKTNYNIFFNKEDAKNYLLNGEENNNSTDHIISSIMLH